MILTEKDFSASLLPMALKDAEIKPVADASVLGAKIAARSGMPVKGVETPYHLYVHGLPGIGLWFEVGPAGAVDWSGAFFGVHDAEIDFHGVGSAGSIPERAVLEYPVKGIKMMLEEKEITAWGIQNRLDASSSYYVRVQGEPDTILFGPYPDGDELDAHVISF
jgi:hypothetical protein